MKLLNQNKSLTEELKQNEAQNELLCHDSFAKIEGDRGRLVASRPQA